MLLASSVLYALLNCYAVSDQMQTPGSGVTGRALAFEDIDARGFFYFEYLLGMASNIFDEQGDKFPLALFLAVDSRPNYFGSLLGRYIRIPLLESRMYAKDDKNFTMIDPRGKTWNLSRRDPKSAQLVGGDSTKADIKGSLVTASLNSGEKLVFLNGVLVEWNIAPSRTLKFTYSQSEKKNISVQESDRELLRFTYKSENECEALIGSKRIKFKMEDVPLYVPTARRESSFLVKERVLASVVINEQEMLGFRWQPKEGGILNLSIIPISNRGQIPHAVELTVDNTNGQVIQMNGFVYKAAEDKSQHLLTVTRSGEDPATNCTFHFNTNLAKAEWKFANGLQRNLDFFVSKGPLFNKIRKEEVMENGKLTSKNIYGYNENGEIMRNVSNALGTPNFNYDASGRLVSLRTLNGQNCRIDYPSESERIISFEGNDFVSHRVMTISTVLDVTKKGEQELYKVIFNKQTQSSTIQLIKN